MSKNLAAHNVCLSSFQKELALILQREVRDSRIGIVTISDAGGGGVFVFFFLYVVSSSDNGGEKRKSLAYAKVFVTFLCIGEQTPESCLMLLKSMKCRIVWLLAKRIRHRLTPEVRFTYDNTLVEGMRMSNLVSEVVDDKRKQEEAVRY